MNNRLTQFLLKKRDTNHSPSVVIVGETGSGKSCFAMNLALSLNPNWKPKTNLFCDIKRFAEKVNEAEKEVIVFDEASIHLNSKKWLNETNIFFSQIVQTQRYKNNIYIIVVPHILFLAKDHRRMLNVKVETLEFQDKKGFARWWIIQNKWSQMLTYKRSLNEWFIGYLRFSEPPKNIEKEYAETENADKQYILEKILTEVQ